MRNAVIGSKALLAPAWIVLALLLAAPSPTAAQSGNVEALGLVREAMDAYSNLDLDGSKVKLDKAVAMAPRLDKGALARVYVSLGVLQIGGFADNASGQRSFLIALCLDSSIMVDPLLSTPEIDMLLTMARNQVNPAQCQQTLSAIPLPGPSPGPEPPPAPDPGLQPCGQHTPPVEQRQKYELPIYLELAPHNHGRVNRLAFKYSFDGAPNFNELEMKPAGRGVGVLIDCDRGQIRVFDPSSISYYIEGYDRMGNLVCGHGTANAPLVVAMTPTAEPLPALPGGAPPRECAPCAPWDVECQQRGLPGLDQPCFPATGCAGDLICGDIGLCVDAEGKVATGGPSTFYVNAGFGTGAGYMTTKMTFDKITDPRIDDPSSTEQPFVEEVDDKPAGMAWSGLPARLAVGFYLIDRLALEVTGRFDVKIDSFLQPVRCIDSGDDWKNNLCLGDPQTEDEAKTSIALRDDGQPAKKTQTMLAWLANIRARYDLVDDGGLRISAFLGVGYGRIKYRIADGDTKYFPMPGFINIEVGAQLMYYFTPNYGIGIEVPIDFMVADGFALNFEAILVPVSVGF